MWLHGIPGCGKTVLSAAVVQDVLEDCTIDSVKAVAYFYFDFNDAHKQSSELMMKSLIFQIAGKNPDCLPMLDSLWAQCDDGTRGPSLRELYRTLRQMIESQPTYIVLDALDECQDKDRLLTILEKISEWKCNNLHTLFTSRKEQDIEDSLEDLVENIIPIDRGKVDRDIGHYIRHRLTMDRAFKSLRKNCEDWKGEKKAIEKNLRKGSQGMHVVNVNLMNSS